YLLRRAAAWLRFRGPAAGNAVPPVPAMFDIDLAALIRQRGKDCLVVERIGRERLAAVCGHRRSRDLHPFRGIAVRPPCVPRAGTRPLAPSLEQGAQVGMVGRRWAPG